MDLILAVLEHCNICRSLKRLEKSSLRLDVLKFLIVLWWVDVEVYIFLAKKMILLVTHDNGGFNTVVELPNPKLMFSTWKNDLAI